MKKSQKRYSKAFGIAIAVHLALCVAIAALGFTVARRSPQILEVTLAGGPPPKLGNPKAVPTEQPKEKQQIVKPKKDDIVEKRKDVPKDPTPEQANTAPETPGDANGSEQGVENGTGTDPDSKGDGSGSGDGEKRGVPATPPRVTYSYKPPYPAGARSSGIQGTSYVKVLVNESGKVMESFLASSSGNSSLDNAAVSAAYKWRFAPAKDGFGQPCPCYITIPIKFKLQ